MSFTTGQQLWHVDSDVVYPSTYVTDAGGGMHKVLRTLYVSGDHIETWAFTRELHTTELDARRAQVRNLKSRLALARWALRKARKEAAAARPRKVKTQPAT